MEKSRGEAQTQNTASAPQLDVSYNEKPWGAETQAVANSEGRGPACGDPGHKSIGRVGQLSRC